MAKKTSSIMRTSAIVLLATSFMLVACLAEFTYGECGSDCSSDCENCVTSNCGDCSNNCGCTTRLCHQSCAVRCQQCSNTCSSSCRRRVLDSAPEAMKQRQEQHDLASERSSNTDLKNDANSNVTSIFDITSSVSNNNTIHMPVEYTFNHHTNVTVVPAPAPNIHINVTTGGGSSEPRVITLPSAVSAPNIIPHNPNGSVVNINHTTVTTSAGQPCCNITPSNCQNPKSCSETVCGPRCNQQPYPGFVQQPWQVPVQQPVQYPVPQPIQVPVPQPYPQPYPVIQRVAVPQPYPVVQRVPVPQPYPVERQVPVPQPYPVVQRVAVPQPYPVERQVAVPQPYPVVQNVPVPQPYPVERQVPVPQPYPVVQRIPVPIPQPYPVERPVPVVLPQPPPVYTQPAPVYTQPSCLLNTLQGGQYSACAQTLENRQLFGQSSAVALDQWSQSARRADGCITLNQYPWTQCNLQQTGVVGFGGLPSGRILPEQRLAEEYGRKLNCKLRQNALRCT